MINPASYIKSCRPVNIPAAGGLDWLSTIIRKYKYVDLYKEYLGQHYSVFPAGSMGKLFKTNLSSSPIVDLLSLGKSLSLESFNEIFQNDPNALKSNLFERDMQGIFFKYKLNIFEVDKSLPIFILSSSPRFHTSPVAVSLDNLGIFYAKDIFKYIRSNQTSGIKSIIDLGAGSGVLGISAYKAIGGRGKHLVFIDVLDESYNLVSLNAYLNNIENSIFCENNSPAENVAFLKRLGNSLTVSNPPWNIQNFDFFDTFSSGGNDGLEVAEIFLKQFIGYSSSGELLMYGIFPFTPNYNFLEERFHIVGGRGRVSVTFFNDYLYSIHSYAEAYFGGFSRENIGLKKLNEKYENRMQSLGYDFLLNSRFVFRNDNNSSPSVTEYNLRPGFVEVGNKIGVTPHLIHGWWLRILN